MDFSGSKILIVDDEESIRFTFKAFLKKAGCITYASENLEKAIAFINKENFDLIFVDIVLKNEKGSDLLSFVKSRCLNTPVIMITGEPGIDSATEAVRLGAFDYLIKPVKKETLLSVTRYALNHKKITDLNKKILKEKDIYRKNLDAIFKTVKDGILTVDPNFNIIEANNSFKKICGVSDGDIKGQKFINSIKNCNKECLNIIEKTLKEKKYIDELRLDCINHKGKSQTVLVSCSNLPDEKGALIVIRDITKISLMEKELNKRKSFELMIGKSKKMQSIFDLISGLGDTDTTVLITGESGTGKELAAKSLHSRSSRSDHPFIAINCSALSENLLESELFGHVKGAFTGAIKNKKGRFLSADNGTIFLDEIGDIPPEIQVKLLRFLQEKEFEPVGSDKTIRVDVRVITATNKNIKGKVKKGEFREDLYYRLNVFNLEMPPLRERMEDIPVLFEHFKNIFNKKMKKNIRFISEEVLDIFSRYRWPGNIRELEHVIEYAFVLTPGEIILPKALPADLSDNIKNDIPEFFEDEKEAIIKALKNTDWNKAKASRLLGISRQTLYRKMDVFGL